ncbi:hypothetical protein Q5H93_07010 [Hymenobacter sp. ASUV-10]|uniref:Uncharacterized protein n=1 Tax=Hymenobacter aranciens TaxID=3063996 RepID=A0ABT9B872_9BACT|nr:hypothetical protein [Hymenobacter sp. ASUV-10]
MRKLEKQAREALMMASFPASIARKKPPEMAFLALVGGNIKD